MNDDKKLDALEVGLVPSPEIDLSVSENDSDLTEEIAKAMDK
ncbi:hypothetical protein [Weissella cibaria]|nr:hypothetical protein [Weissella cibaria]